MAASSSATSASATGQADFAPIAALPDAVRVGLCGIGRTGFGRIRKEILVGGRFRMQAGFDLLPERVDAFREMFGATPYSSFEAMLADPLVEIVIIATRSDTHAALATQALRAGKDVVVEKPMAVNLAEADALIAEARRHPKQRLFVRHNRRFDPAFQFALEVVASGKLGALHSVQLRVGEYVRRSDWQTLKRFGGGQLLNWGPHVVDWALQLIGGRAVEQWSDLKLIAAAGDSEDHVKLLLKGPTGIVADLEISGANAARQPFLVVQGERGALTLADDDHATLRYLRVPPNRAALMASAETPKQDDKKYKADDPAEWITETPEPRPSVATDFWSLLYGTLRQGRAFPVTLEQSREVMRIIEVARMGF